MLPTKKPIVLALAIVLASLVINTIEAKMILKPKNRAHRVKGGTKTGKKIKDDKHQHIIFLKPQEQSQPQQQQQQVSSTSPNLKLEATISTNENGAQVLKLTQASAQLVNTALQQTSYNQQQQQPQQQLQQQNEYEIEMLQATATSEEEEEPMEQQVLFYDPNELKTAAGEPPLPTRVFDANGNEVDMTGKEAVLVPPHDHHSSSDNSETASTSNSKSSFTKTDAQIVQTPTQSQDQLIILSTVATMALLVGALSARRLRSKQFLSFCIENENLEEELAYDAAYTTQSTVGESSFYSGGGGYDTFGNAKYGGDLRWRGDLEKFDV